MIIATRPCGCPPKKEDPPCPPCCTPAQRRQSKPEVGCCSTKSLKSILSRPKVVQQPQQQPVCCPIKPECEKVQVNKIHSEIKERGLPYKELEVMINNNKLVVRTQKEPPIEEFDPPCNCKEDPRAKIIEDEKKEEQVSDNRTLTLFPKPSTAEYDENGILQKEVVEEVPPVTRILEENPNIFRLRVKKKSKDGHNIDFEFRTPRPWSKQMRENHEEALARMMKSKEPEAKEGEDENVKEKKKKKRRRSSKRKKKKKDECEEILARPPCGEKKKKKKRGKIGNC